MTDQELRWTPDSERVILHTPVFDVIEQDEVAYSGLRGTYDAMDAPDWAMVIPETEGRLVLVRQWRHAAQQLSMEFPGGVVDANESPEDAARRELLEETGYTAGEIIHLGSCSPNPALFRNHFHVYLAHDLVQTGACNPDEDEFLQVSELSADEVIDNFGGDLYPHALMGTAIAFYLRYKDRKK